MNTTQDLNSCPKFKALLQNFRTLTESNCHTEAFTATARFFNFRELAKSFEAIEVLHCNFYRFLHPSLSDVRKDLKDWLFIAIEEKHGPDIRKQAHNCL